MAAQGEFVEVSLELRWLTPGWVPISDSGFLRARSSADSGSRPRATVRRLPAWRGRFETVAGWAPDTQKPAGE